MRLLLDEGYPSPPGFDPGAVDASVHVTSLREFDMGLVGSRTPDWYLYLRAAEAEFDVLVTQDLNQSQQLEELWTLMHTDLSIITWRRAVDDPVRMWGQMLAYLPEIRRIIEDHGQAFVLLPSPRLTKSNLTKASEELGKLSGKLGRSNQELRDAARLLVEDELAQRGELDRFPQLHA